jgi:methionine sulfoxide reductase catalytic subunit
MRRAIDTPLPSDITDECTYTHRRAILAALGAGMLGNAFGKNASVPLRAIVPNPKFSVSDTMTTWADATSYNNYYEFGADKAEPAGNASNFNPAPWSVEIAGECEVKGRFGFEDLIKPQQLEERIYRHRCVEAWSMVLPWVGVALAPILQRFKPTNNAKYVAFHTLYDPARMPLQRTNLLEWPYREGLRMDEAMHPLSLLAVGLYGRELPNQNGAPLRLVTPWKYGFKGIKSIVKIEFQETMPYTSWNASNPDEYGFYANVNPKLDHPRWSQASERRLAGSGLALFKSKRIDTLPFNGYAEQVASLYAGMDLVQNF